MHESIISHKQFRDELETVIAKNAEIGLETHLFSGVAYTNYGAELDGFFRDGKVYLRIDGDNYLGMVDINNAIINAEKKTDEYGNKVEDATREGKIDAMHKYFSEKYGSRFNREWAEDVYKRAYEYIYDVEDLNDSTLQRRAKQLEKQGVSNFDFLYILNMTKGMNKSQKEDYVHRIYGGYKRQAQNMYQVIFNSRYDMTDFNENDQIKIKTYMSEYGKTFDEIVKAYNKAVLAQGDRYMTKGGELRARNGTLQREVITALKTIGFTHQEALAFHKDINVWKS